MYIILSRLLPSVSRRLTVLASGLVSRCPSPVAPWSVLFSFDPVTVFYARHSDARVLPLNIILSTRGKRMAKTRMLRQASPLFRTDTSYLIGWMNCQLLEVVQR